MKKMKLFFLGICAAFASTAMAQEVTLTAADATNKDAGWMLTVQAPSVIAGWQMQVDLPDGVTIPSKELKVGDATFTEYEVALTGYGDKYKAVGTATDNGVFLFFIPVASEYAASDFQVAENTTCTITLKATNYEAAAAVTVTNLCAADADGKSIAMAGPDACTVNHPKGDASCDFKVNGTDIQTVINNITSSTYAKASDANNDNKVNGSDIQTIIGVITQ